VIEASGLLSKHLFIMELHFDAIFYSKLGNENSDASHSKCSRGPQVPHPWLTRCTNTNSSVWRKYVYPNGTLYCYAFKQRTLRNLV